MASATQNNGNVDHALKEEGLTNNMTHEEHETAKAAARFGYGPLAKISTADGAMRLPAFGGEFQPGLYKGVAERKFANPAPLGLSAFALTTFVLSLVNVRARGLEENNVVISLAFGYGGLVQLLAGMWYVFPLIRRFRDRETNLLNLGKWPLATPSVPLHCPRTAGSGSHSPFSSRPAALTSSPTSRQQGEAKPSWTP
jgi:hypothetical protein